MNTGMDMTCLPVCQPLCVRECLRVCQCAAAFGGKVDGNTWGYQHGPPANGYSLLSRDKNHYHDEEKISRLIYASAFTVAYSKGWTDEIQWEGERRKGEEEGHNGEAGCFKMARGVPRRGGKRICRIYAGPTNRGRVNGRTHTSTHAQHGHRQSRINCRRIGGEIPRDGRSLAKVMYRHLPVVAGYSGQQSLE